MNLYAKIENDIQEAINTGRLKPGARIPSVNELRSQYGVSHITVRRVYQELGAKNLICKRGLGYAVQNRESSGGEIRTNTIADFLRIPRPQNNYDNFFNNIHAEVQRQCASHGMNLFTPYICSYLSQPYTLTPEKLERFIPAMRDCAGLVDAYIVDERIPDDILGRVMDAVGKPFFLINRGSKLPNIDSVVPANRKMLPRGFDAARQMNYDALIYLQSGHDYFNGLELTAAFEECRANWPEVRLVPDCSIQSWEVTRGRLEAALNELLKKKRRVLIFLEGGGLYELTLTYILEHPEYVIGGNCGVMTGRNYGYSEDVPVKPACFVQQPEKMAETAVENLLERLRDPNRPYHCYKVELEFNLGESLYPISQKIKI